MYFMCITAVRTCVYDYNNKQQRFVLVQILAWTIVLLFNREEKRGVRGRHGHIEKQTDAQGGRVTKRESTCACVSVSKNHYYPLSAAAQHPPQTFSSAASSQCYSQSLSLSEWISSHAYAYVVRLLSALLLLCFLVC